MQFVILLALALSCVLVNAYDDDRPNDLLREIIALKLKSDKDAAKYAMDDTQKLYNYFRHLKPEDDDKRHANPFAKYMEKFKERSRNWPLFKMFALYKMYKKFKARNSEQSPWSDDSPRAFVMTHANDMDQSKDTLRTLNQEPEHHWLLGSENEEDSKEDDRQYEAVIDFLEKLNKLQKNDDVGSTDN